MRLCYLAALCLPLSLYGCLTYHDPRPVGEQKSGLHTATVNLAGTYEIVDSRRDHRHFTGAVIRKAYGSDGLDITLTSPTSGSALLSQEVSRLGKQELFGHDVRLARLWGQFLQLEYANGSGSHSQGPRNHNHVRTHDGS